MTMLGNPGVPGRATPGPAPDTPAGHAPALSLIWAELTGTCQLSCLHCYAGSGPDGTHGTMTLDAWETVLTDAAALGAQAVSFIGGEPTMYPGLPRLIRHARRAGLQAEVFTNLVHVTPELWELFQAPGVSVATSWYSGDQQEHHQITGRDTWRQTLANIIGAIRRDIPLRVGLIEGILPGQHAAEGAELLREHGVTDIGTDHLREFGRGTVPDPTQACGNCGHRRAAVLPDGSVTPCPLTRWMTAGNVLATPLADILGGVTDMAATLAELAGRRALNRCDPDSEPGPCMPEKCNPERGAAAAVQQAPAGRDCMPDHYCNPTCSPGACQPNI